MSDHKTSAEAQAMIDYWGKTSSMAHLHRAHHEYEAKNGKSAQPDAASPQPGSASGPKHPAPSPGKLQLRVFSDRTVTLRWMQKFDEINKKNVPEIEMPGKGRMSHQQFLNTYVIPVAKQVRQAINIIYGLNDASRTEAANIPKTAVANIEKLIAASNKDLDRAGAGLDAGHYETAYCSFIQGLNVAMHARAEIGVYNKQAIDEADRMVTTLEITRDSGFALLSIAMPEHVVLIGIAAAVTKGADDWAGGKDFKTVGFEFVLNILLGKLGGKVEETVVKAFGPTLEHWLNSALGGLIEKGISGSPILRKIADWAATQPEAEMRKACVRLMAGNKLSPAEAKPIIDALRRYIAEKHIINLMLKKLTEHAKDVVNTFGKVCYASLQSSHEHLPFKEACFKLLEETGKEIAKDSKAKSDLLWSMLSHVANAL